MRVQNLNPLPVAKKRPRSRLPTKVLASANWIPPPYRRNLTRWVLHSKRRASSHCFPKRTNSTRRDPELNRFCFSLGVTHPHPLSSGIPTSDAPLPCA